MACRNSSILAFMVSIVCVTGGRDSAASGLYIGENGPKAIGRGGAFVANPTDLYAFSYNPAGLTQFPAWNFTVGLGSLHSESSFTPDEESSELLAAGKGTVDNQGPLFTPLPSIFASHQFDFRKLTVAAGFTTPPGVYKYSYDPNGPQRFMMIDSRRIEYVAGIAAAMEVLPNLSVGGLFGLETLDVQLSRKIVVSLDGAGGPGKEGLVDLAAKDLARPMFAAGAKYKAGPVHIGASYWRGVKYKAKGDLTAKVDAKLENVLGGLALPEEDLAQSISVDTVVDPVTVFLNLPDIIRAGVGVGDRKFYVEAGIGAYLWSTHKNMFVDIPEEEQNLPLEPPVSLLGGAFTLDKATFPPTTIDQNMEDVIDYRFGVEYTWNDDLLLRTGVLIQPPAVPESTQILFNFDSFSTGLGGGFTKEWGHFSLDVAGMYLLRGKVETDESDILALNGLAELSETDLATVKAINNGKIPPQFPAGNGTYEGDAFFLFLGANYHF